MHHAFYRQIDATVLTDHSLLPLSLSCAATHTCPYLCIADVLIPTQISSYFSREIHASALHKSMRAGNSQLASLGSADLSPPYPAGDRALALLADFGDSVSWPAEPGPLIFPFCLSCCMFSCCFFIFHRHLAKEKQPCTSKTF